MSLRRIKTLLLLSFFVASIIGGVDIVLSSKKAQAAAGDAVAGSYGVAVDGSGNIDLSASAFSSIEWVHAALLRLTFKTGQVVDFTPINDKSNGMPPLIDQRINSAAGEGHVTYESTVWPCRATIDFDKNEDRDDSDFVLSILSDGVLDLDFRPESGAACADAGNFNVQPGNPNMSIAYFAWVDENTIATVDGESPGRFTRSDSTSNFFIRDVDAEYESCIDKALVNIADNTLIWWELRDDGRVNFDGDPPGEAKTDEGCKYRTKIDDGGGRGSFNTGFPPNNRTLLIAGTPTTPVDISDLGTTSTDPNCESEGGVFSFILCPALTYANDAIGWLDDRIINALVINKDYYSAKEIKDAWANMRNIGYIVLIPILLLMVIGTALQFNFLDPYTVKRALPRLFVAIIFMAVSYDACRIMIEIVNGVGRGVSGIIAIPFGGFDKLTLQNIFTAPSGAGNVVWGGILAGVAIASLFVVSIGILFSYLFVAALALLIIFILLSVRELMIIFLIIISPLAIIAWIFPGNDKMWKLWWGTFSKMLYIFPIIMGLLTVGRAFAYVVKMTPTEENAVVLTIVKLTAFIGPYFFIPKAFQMAGGAFANLAGMVNDRGKGMFDRQRKYRADKRKDLRHAIASGNRFKNARHGSLLEAVNTAAEKSMQLNKMGPNPKNWRRNLNARVSNHSNLEAQEFMEKNHAFAAFKGDDDMLKAAEFQDEEQIRAALIRHGGARFRNDRNAQDQAIALIRQAQQETGIETFQKARVMSLPATGTAYQYAYDANGNVMEEEILNEDGSGTGVYKKVEREDGVDLVEMLKDINKVFGADRSGAGVALAKMRGASVQAGQVIAGKAGYATMAGQLGRLYTSQNLTAAQQQLVEADARNIVVQDAIDSSTPGEALYGKPSSAAAYAGGWGSRIQDIARKMHDPNSGVEFDDLARAIASTGGLLDAAGQAAPQNAREMERLLQSMQVDLSGLNIPGMPPGQAQFSVRDLIDNQAFGSDAHRGMRRDYANQAVAGFQNAAAAAATAAAVAAAGGAPPTPPTGLPPSPSDIRLKREVNYVGVSINNIPLYSFKYNWDDTTYVGVMAQDLLFTHKDALHVNSDGYFEVDYAKLGLEMITIDEWIIRNKRS
ncbi:MAG TPA: tail fiber domain-containing protein [Candidatus Saccharibacteria bacterium]|jgi:hypothetical protein|nr:tail fiber domain-containing protein [Candidatus Saccharibacteria bacterium]